MISDYISEGTGGDPDWNRNFSLGVHQTNSFESNKKIQSFIIQGIITDHVLLREEKQTVQQFQAIQPGQPPVYRGEELSF